MKSCMSTYGTGRIVLITLIIIIGGVPFAVSPSAGASPFGSTLTAPDNATTGQEVTFSTSFNLIDLFPLRDPSANVTLTLYVDGKAVATKEVPITDGETVSTGINHTFSSAGNRTATVEGTVTLGGQTYSTSRSKSIYVDPGDLGSLDLTANIPDSTTAGTSTNISTTVSLPNVPGKSVNGTVRVAVNANGTLVSKQRLKIADGETETLALTPVFNRSGTVTVTITANGTLNNYPISGKRSKTITIQPAQSTFSGAVFTVPPSLTDEVANYRDQHDIPSNLHTLILAQNDSVALVFTDQTPQKGIATARGVTWNNTIPWRDFRLSVVVARDIRFSTVGTVTTVPEVVNSPQEHQLDLVRINASYRRLSTLYDPDTGENTTVAQTAGFLVADDQRSGQRINQIGRTASRFGLNSSTRFRGGNTSRELRTALLNDSTTRVLPTVEFESHFAATGDATVDGIVLSPGTTARQFAETADQAHTISDQSAQPVLYIVNESFASQPVANASVAKQQPDGTVVEFSTRLYQARLSSQESLEHWTPCGTNQVQVQTPSGPICTNIINDVLTHGGVAWSDTPTTHEEVLIVGGLSSREVDRPVNTTSGEYHVVGEIVRTSRIDPHLPNRSALLIYELSRTDDLDLDELQPGGEEFLRTETDDIQTQLQEQFNTTSNTTVETSNQTENGTLTGQVVWDNGTAIPNVTVVAVEQVDDSPTLIPVNPTVADVRELVKSAPDQSRISVVHTNASGAFTQNLPAGEYSLIGYTDSTELSTAESVSVQNNTHSQSTLTVSTTPSVIDQYDENGDGIETAELLTGIADWRQETINTSDLLTLIGAWREA